MLMEDSCATWIKRSTFVLSWAYTATECHSPVCLLSNLPFLKLSQSCGHTCNFELQTALHSRCMSRFEIALNSLQYHEFLERRYLKKIKLMHCTSLKMKSGFEVALSLFRFHEIHLNTFRGGRIGQGRRLSEHVHGTMHTARSVRGCILEGNENVLVSSSVT